MSKAMIVLSFFCILIPPRGLYAQIQDIEAEEFVDSRKQIRQETFDLLLPQIMREQKIDMWIQVMRELNPDPVAAEMGSASGVFIFTDRGGDRIERAVLGTIYGQYSDLLRDSGAYDIIARETCRIEMPGGPETELDHRFTGVGKFVAQRDPRRIAVNYLDNLGKAVTVINEIPTRLNEGISYTDYLLLTEAIGDKYAKRIVSAEHLIMDYLSKSAEKRSN